MVLPLRCFNIQRRDNRKVISAMDNSVPQHVYKKNCPKCNTWLPFSDFNADRNIKDGLTSYCKSCRSKIGKEYRPSGSWRKQNLRRVGMTPQRYDQMLAEQGGVCKVCKQPETRKRPWSKNGEINPLAVDHDHKTGEARALLCSHCNTSLGKLGEDPERIRALADYAEWCQTREPLEKLVQRSLWNEAG